MSTTSPISSLDQLHDEYETLAEKARRYARANFIFDFQDADLTYAKLLLKREKAYYNYKKAKTANDDYFNYRFAPVINHKIQLFKNKIISLGGIEALKGV